MIVINKFNKNRRVKALTLNAPGSNLFARFEPLEKNESLFSSFVTGNESKTVVIRPVWLIGDLRSIYDWRNAPLRRTNWQLNPGRSAMQYYNHLLLSDYAQAFMLEQNGLPILQISVLPGWLANYPNPVHFNPHDYALEYLYNDNFRDPLLFQHGLEVMLVYLFSFPETACLYIKLDKPERVMDELLGRLGFVCNFRNNFFGKTCLVYRILRA